MNLKMVSKKSFIIFRQKIDFGDAKKENEPPLEDEQENL